MRPRREFLKIAGVGAPLVLSRCGSRGSGPNFVFVLVDDLGWRDLGCYGSTFHDTPNLDRLATGGVRFTNAYAACPVCSPTRASIMTGKYPARIQLTDWIPGRQNWEEMHRYMKVLPPKFEHQMALEEVTLAEALKEGGYRTGFAGKWHMGQTEEFWPEHQGFDVNKGGWRAGAPYYRQYDAESDTWSGDSGFVSPYKNPRLEDGPEGEYLTDRLADEAVRFIRENQGDPFLMYLSFYTVHNPLHGKRALVEKYKAKALRQGVDQVASFVTGLPWMERPDPGLWRERVIQSNAEYAAMVESMDENVGRVLDTLDELGIADNTVVFFMADNGGLTTSEGSPTSNLPLRAGKGWLYEGGIREPMMVRWPGVARPGTVCDVPVTSTDFYPTMLEMAGLPARPEQHADGESLAPLLRGGRLDREAIYWHYPHYSNQGERPGGAVRSGDFKLIEYYEDMRVELYNLAEDVGETRDLAGAMPQKVEELRADLHAWRESVGASMPQPNPNYDPSAPGAAGDLTNDPN